MSTADVQSTVEGLKLSGVIDHRTGPALRQKGKKLLNAGSWAEIVLDCSAVTKASSVGLSLILAYMRDAESLGKPLSIHDLPQDLRQIAEVSQLLELLPVRK